MRVRVLRVGRGGSPWVEAGVQEFARRIHPFRIDDQPIKPEPFRGDVDAVRQAESRRLLQALRAGERLVLLDERGELPTSEEFAAWLGRGEDLAFAIGGPYGHDPALRDRAWKVLALGRWVTNHELARLVLVEQLYRASTLLWGGSYHHA